uniref:Partner of Y14 and mago n=1 Tax=Culicoides sonorensis TaxID=179676 RepID=A0A336MRZ7_CULSO
MTTYETDVNGKFIPATQRPDGTWRKARRVKDGYVPQDEVPLYESKAKKIQAQRPNNSLPVGMCPLVAQAVKEKQEKQLKKQKLKEQQQQQQPKIVNSTPGLLNVTSKFEAVKKPKNNSSSTQQQSSSSSQHENNQKQGKEPPRNVTEITDKIDDLAIDDRQEVTKKLKKLRKKLREIEEIEQKIASGELAKPEKDQLDKVARKSEILSEIQELESVRKVVK